MLPFKDDSPRGEHCNVFPQLPLWCLFANINVYKLTSSVLYHSQGNMNYNIPNTYGRRGYVLSMIASQCQFAIGHFP